MKSPLMTAQRMEITKCLMGSMMNNKFSEQNKCFDNVHFNK